MRHANTHANIMFSTLINFLNTFPEKITIAPSYTNLSKALEFTSKYFNKVGIIFIISDFIGLSNWEKNIYKVSQKHNIFSFQIYDPLDFTLVKAGYLSIIDPETNKRVIVNTDSKLVQEAYVNLMREKQEQLNIFLKKIGAKHFLIEKGDFL